VKYSNRFIILVCGAVSIFCIVPLVFFHSRAVLAANDASRWDTVWSLTHGEGYVIDEAPYETADKVRNHGHFYSSKPALLPTLVAALSLVVSGITGATLPDKDYILVPIVVTLINTLPFALVMYHFGRWLAGLPYSDFTKMFCLLTAAFGTYLTAYNTSLNNHTVAAVALLFTLIIGSRISAVRPARARDFLACGLLSAWVVANELPAGFFCVLIFLHLWRIDRAKTVKFFVPGALLVTILFFCCTRRATGGFIPFYLRKNLYHYPGSFWNEPQMIFGWNDSRAVYIFNFILGHHGLISLSPVLLFGLWGMFTKQTPAPLRFAAIALTAINSVFIFSVTHDYGGNVQGPRWFMWLIPFWLLCMPPVVERFGNSTFGKLILMEVLAFSFASLCYATFAWPSGPWSPSWIYVLMHGQSLAN
jgi:hypothetical protein